MSSKCKSQLTLEQRYTLIKDSDNGLSQRKLAEKYKISVGAVNKNLKRKRDITDAHDLNLNPKTKQMRPNCKFEDINEKIFAWFQGARARNIPISGPSKGTRNRVVSWKCRVQRVQRMAGDFHSSLPDQFPSFVRRECRSGHGCRR